MSSWSSAHQVPTRQCPGLEHARLRVLQHQKHVGDTPCLPLPACLQRGRMGRGFHRCPAAAYFGGSLVGDDQRLRAAWSAALPCRRCGANNCNNWLGLEVGGAPTPNKVQHGGRVAVFQLTLFGFGVCGCLVEAPQDFMAQGFAAADYGGANKKTAA